MNPYFYGRLIVSKFDDDKVTIALRPDQCMGYETNNFDIVVMIETVKAWKICDGSQRWYEAHCRFSDLFQQIIDLIRRSKVVDVD